MAEVLIDLIDPVELEAMRNERAHGNAARRHDGYRAVHMLLAAGVSRGDDLVVPEASDQGI